MNKQERSGISFGFSLVLIWLILLTGFVMYDKMIEDRGITKTIFLPPPPQLEVIEVEGGLL